MKIHEYQAKEILNRFEVRTPRGRVATVPEEVYDIARQLGGTVVVKAQIHAGGRGKAGGVKLARTPEEAETIARDLIGRKLYTPQTGPEGRTVRRVLVEEGLNIRREYYLGIVVDRAAQRIVFMASAEGGVEIEEVAARNPAAILREHIDPAVGFRRFQARKLAYELGVAPENVPKAAKFLEGLYEAFYHSDASMAEINPFVETAEGEFYALDAKINLDDNALFRQPAAAAMRDYTEEEPLEIEASRHGLNYIKLDGNIGCMVNGAGLAMATLDIITLCGGRPANFLDVSGGATEASVSAAFRILLADPAVKAVLVNIFGGIVRCDVIARGILGAVKSTGLNVPLVIRLEGTNVEEGKDLLRKSGLDLILAGDMKDAARKATDCVPGA